MASLYSPSRTGLPVSAGAKLYFYRTGTTTPLDTYSQSDLAMGHENTNPVVADSNGVFGPIYLKATPDYKSIWTNAANTLSFTTDPLLTASVSVITTRGDLIVGNSSNVATGLPIGSAATYLRSDGTDPAWHVLAAADLTGTVSATAMPAGTVLQSFVTSSNTASTHTTVIPYDDTIPQIGEGDLLFTQAITPSSTTNKVRVLALLQVDCGAGMSQAALFRNGGSDAIAAVGSAGSTNDNVNQLQLYFQDVPGSVSAQTYTLRVGPLSGSLYINSISGGRKYGGALVSYMLVEELKV